MRFRGLRPKIGFLVEKWDFRGFRGEIGVYMGLW